MYGVLFSATARKKLEKFERATQKRIVSALERIRVRPEDHLKRIVGSPYHRLRVGDYRVIVGVQKDKLVILVITIGHRKKVYKR